MTAIRLERKHKANERRQNSGHRRLIFVELQRMTTPTWHKAYRSFYYANAPITPDPVLPSDRTVLLVIDIQNAYLVEPDDPKERARWQPFF